MKNAIQIWMILFLPMATFAQNLSEGLLVNDLSLRPMTEINKPDYLSTIVDPSFGTTIRRISNAGEGGVIVPMYSTVQAWNADETLMILYNQSMSYHELLDGKTYEFLRVLNDISPNDLEQIFWDFDEPDIFFYHENVSNDFIKYSVTSEAKEVLLNLTEISGCNGGIEMGNDVQMMSWDSDVFTFRCNNESAFSYRISTKDLTTINIVDLEYNAPAVSPSGEKYYHGAQVYDNQGNYTIDLNLSSTEHSCLGKLANGNDAYFAISFAEGPNGGCLGDIIAHDLETGVCFPLISQEQGYDYSQSGTHISALAHKNSEGGWLAASMMGFDKDGQSLLDQELVIAKAEAGKIKVCRIGHHRSDEDEFDYWGEPHAVISPTGTRVLYASDWSGTEDGKSVDSYVVELPAYAIAVATKELNKQETRVSISPNPTSRFIEVSLHNTKDSRTHITIYNSSGMEVHRGILISGRYLIDTQSLSSGLYFFRIDAINGSQEVGRFIKN